MRGVKITKRSNTLAILLATVLLCSCSSRSEDQFWVSGLTLPRGSRIVEQYELDAPPGSAGSRRGSSQTLSFDNKGGWEKVQGHFAAQLSELGYAHRQEENRNTAGGTAVWEKEGGHFSVVLTDRLTTGNSSSRRAGRFSLIIQRETR